MIHCETRGSIAVVRMEHGRVNAVDTELFAAVMNVFIELESADARAIVLTGTGKAFSAGVDLFRVLEGGREYLELFIPALVSAVEQLIAYPKPIIAAVNGHAIAGGCVIACACDYRIMAQGPGTIGVPELLVGVPFPGVALEIVRSLVPAHHVQGLIYTGRTLRPDEALRLGLVDEVVEADALIDRACEMAERFGAIPSVSFRMTKRQLRQPILDQAARYRQEFDLEVQKLWSSAEIQTAIRQYLEKTLRKRQ